MGKFFNLIEANLPLKMSRLRELSESTKKKSLVAALTANYQGNSRILSQDALQKPF